MRDWSTGASGEACVQTNEKRATTKLIRKCRMNRRQPIINWTLMVYKNTTRLPASIRQIFELVFRTPGTDVTKRLTKSPQLNATTSQVPNRYQLSLLQKLIKTRFEKSYCTVLNPAFKLTPENNNKNLDGATESCSVKTRN